MAMGEMRGCYSTDELVISSSLEKTTRWKGHSAGVEQSVQDFASPCIDFLWT